jgi:hypothetical protein
MRPWYHVRRFETIRRRFDFRDDFRGGLHVRRFDGAGFEVCSAWDRRQSKCIEYLTIDVLMISSRLWIDSIRSRGNIRLQVKGLCSISLCRWHANLERNMAGVHASRRRVRRRRAPLSRTLSSSAQTKVSRQIRHQISGHSYFNNNVGGPGFKI